MSRKVNEEFESTFNELLRLAELLAKSKNQSRKREKKVLADFIAKMNDPEVLQEVLFKLKNPTSLIATEQIIIAMSEIKAVIPIVTTMLEKKSEEINLRRPAGSRQSVVLSTEEFTVEQEPWIVAKTKILYRATYTNYVGQLTDFVQTQNEVKRVVESISDTSQLDRMVEDLEASKLVNRTPEYAKTVDNVMTQIIIPHKNTLAENQENSMNLVEEPEASPAKKVAHHRGIFGSLKQLFQNGKSTTLKEEIIDATVLATTDADEDLSEIDAEDLDSGKGSLELVGLEVEATGLKKLIQDFKAKHPERKAAALKGLNNIVARVGNLLKKPSEAAEAKTKPNSKFNKEFEKLIKDYDRNDFLEKGYPAILKIIAKNNDISALEQAIKAIPPLGVDDLDARINIHAALARRIDEIRWPVAEKETPSEVEINLDELVEPDFTPEQLRQSGAFSDEEFSAMMEEPAEEPKRFDIFLKLKGLTARFKRTEKRVEKVQNEDPEIERIQKELDESLQYGEGTFIFIGDVVDPDNLLADAIIIDGMVETVEAVDSVEKSAKSQPTLDNSRFAKFKKVVADVCARISEKVFPFQGTLERLAIRHHVSRGKKKADIEQRIVKLIDSNNNILEVTRALHNIEAKNDPVLQILVDKLGAKEKALLDTEDLAQDLNYSSRADVVSGNDAELDLDYSPDREGVRQAIEDLKYLRGELDDESLDIDSLEDTKEELPAAVPQFVKDAAEPARKAAEDGRKGPESTDDVSFTKK